MTRRRLLALFLLLPLAAGCDSLTGASDVEYTITGTASRVDITYESSGGGSSQIGNAAVPWSYSFNAERDQFLYVSAQIVSQDGGSIQVTIRKNGDTLDSATASGFASIATASGTND